MKDASQFPVTDPFGATYAPWSKAHPHLGEDRSCPCGTPVVVNGVTIGLVGTTGKSSGCHVHLQKVDNGRVVNPAGGGFDIPTPAVVYQTGQKADIGKYVRIRDAKGVEWSRFHLSEIKVKEDQQIGDRVNPTEQDVKDYFKAWEGRQPTKAELADYTKRSWRYLTDKFLADLEGEYQEKIKQLEKSPAVDPDGEKWRKIKSTLKELLK